ncbi:pyrimidine reductase family protein [Arthrobacter sp. NPDC055585]
MSSAAITAAGSEEELNDSQLLDAYAWDTVPGQAGRPCFRFNFIASLDGAVSFNGRSGELGNDADRRVFGLLRSTADLILVGAGTVRTEGYAGDLLPARTQSGRARRGLAAHPGIAVVSASLDLDPESGFFAEAPVRPLILTAAAAPESRRSALEEVADVVVAGARTVEPRQAAAVLAGRGHHRVLCEGGPQLFGSFQSAGLVDELCLTLAPVLAAGAAGRISAGAPELGLARLRLTHVLRSGDTLLLRYLAS